MITRKALKTNFDPVVNGFPGGEDIKAKLRRNITVSDVKFATPEHLRNIRRFFDDVNSSKTVSFGSVSGIPYYVKIKWLDEEEIFDKNRRSKYLRMIKHLEVEESKFYSEKVKKEKGNKGA